jgi:hypothetical protein
MKSNLKKKNKLKIIFTKTDHNKEKQSIFNMNQKM